MSALSQQLPLRDMELRMPQALSVSWNCLLQHCAAVAMEDHARLGLNA